MGWFSDSESEDETNNKPSGDQNEKEEEEEEDPLDAYMNQLQQNSEKEDTSATATSDQRQQQPSKASRFDLDDQEHAKEDFQTRSAAKLQEEDNLQASDDGDDDEKVPAATSTPHMLPKADHAALNYEEFQRDFFTGAHPKSSTIGVNWRREHGVSIKEASGVGRSIPDPVINFADISGILTPALTSEIQACGYQKPTPIQSQCLPLALSGRDIIGIASTGSGKTLAFVWPMVVHCCSQRELRAGEGPICVILSPTRELAMQTFAHAKKMLSALDGHAIALFGGVGRYEMTKELKRGAECVVGTPGRLIDMVKSKATNLQRCTLVVLDEADKMLEMGFEAQVKSILENTRADRQTLMFSATFKARTSKLANVWLRDPVRVDVGQVGASSDHVDQHVMVLNNEAAKMQFMTAMMPTFVSLGRIIIFAASRVGTETISQELSKINEVGNKIACIHGDKSQHERNKALGAFKKGKVIALVATDVAARGLDVSDIMTVVNYDAAKNLDSHTHRVGRAGRLTSEHGTHKKGNAYTLLTGKNKDFANSLVGQFNREGRPVGEDLINLAKRSRHYKDVNVVIKKQHKQKRGAVLSGFVRGSDDQSSFGASSGSKRSRKS